MRITRALAGAALSVGLVGGMAGPAMAARAQPMTFTDQFTDCFVEDSTTYCVEGTSTTKIIEKGPDTYLLKNRSTFVETVERNGVVMENGSQRSSFMTKVRGGEETIFKVKGSGRSGSCTFDFKLLVVKGVVKHEVDDFECDDVEGAT